LGTNSRHACLAILLLCLLLMSCADLGQSPTDPVHQPRIMIGDASATEGSPLRFEVSLDTFSTEAIVFAYATGDITATANQDYIAAAGNDTIPAGVTSHDLIVASLDDGDDEPVENFAVTLHSAIGASFTDSVAVGTINDNDDPAISFAIHVRPILQSNCAIVGCHGGGISQGGLALGSADYATVIAATGNGTSVLVPNGRVVQPGSSSTSTLYTKTTADKPFGLRMPYTRDSLPTVEQTLIRDWIDQGAADN
jgi:Calx-beta domain